MRVVVVGATGNVGTALLRALDRVGAVDSVLGVARRPPTDEQRALWPSSKLSWLAADISRDSLGFVAGADAVVHLAWLIQPSRNEPVMRRTNVVGTRRLVDAVVDHDVRSLIYASSVGTYARSSKDQPRDETWPADGIPTSTYSRHKAEVELMLDGVEREHPELRIVRLRTSLVFQRSAASEVHGLFLGRLAPWHMPRLVRFIPGIRELMFQATHADDIADAYVRSIVGDGRGPFNVAAGPVLTPRRIADAVHGRVVPVPKAALRLVTKAAYAARVIPAEVGWLDMALQTPIMDTARATDQLGWTPARTSIDALTELLDGIGDGAGGPTPALVPRGQRIHAPAV
jgi:nucleoside-diphosphate-sugar epimerase